MGKWEAQVIHVDSQTALINPQHKYLNQLFHIWWFHGKTVFLDLVVLLGTTIKPHAILLWLQHKKLQLNGINNEATTVYCSQVNDLHYSPTDLPLEDLQHY